MRAGSQAILPGVLAVRRGDLVTSAINSLVLTTTVLCIQAIVREDEGWGQPGDMGKVRTQKELV